MGRRKTSRHHIRPRCRFTVDATKDEMDKDNIVELDEKTHSLIHQLFGVLDREESLKFLSIILQPNTHWSYYRLKKLREAIMRGEL